MSTKMFRMNFRTMNSNAAIVYFLALSLASTIAETATTRRVDTFRQVYIDYCSVLIFRSPARSLLECVKLCSAIASCARAAFSKETGQCQGHFNTKVGAGSNETNGVSVWQRDGAAIEVINVASDKPTKQSSDQRPGQAADMAVQSIFTHSCSNTDGLIPPPHWWQVDLQAIYKVESVTINNTHQPGRWVPRDFDIYIYMEDPQTNPQATSSLCSHQNGQADLFAVLQCSSITAPGRFLQIISTSRLRLCRVLVAACPIFP